MTNPNNPNYSPSSHLEKIALLAQKNAEAEQGGGEARIDAQHKKENLQLESGSPCSWTRVPLKSWISL